MRPVRRPRLFEATRRGPAREGAVAGGAGAAARVSRGQLARASSGGLMESRSCALRAARAERSEALARHLRPETGCSATKLLLSLFSFSGTETEGGLGKHGKELLGEAWQKCKP